MFPIFLCNMKPEMKPHAAQCINRATLTGHKGGLQVSKF